MSTNLSDITSAADLLRRVHAEGVLTLLQRLGFWVGEADSTLRSKRFPSTVSEMHTNELGDENAYWQSELSRAIEIHGALRSQRHTMETTLKRARARALKAEVEKVPADQKMPTKAVFDARVAENPQVMEAEDALVTLNTAIDTLEAVVNAYEGYTRALSREISRRGDQIRGRL